MIVKIKADIETLMPLKAINILIIIISLLFVACAEENNNNNNSNNNDSIYDDNTTKYDFVYNEPVIIYSISGSYDAGNIKKGSDIDNITLSFTNIRNEEVYLLIPESEENQADEVIFRLNNPQNKCKPLEKECSIIFNMIIKDQSPLNDNFTIYLPITLLNKQEMDTFIEMNKDYKKQAMKYLINRIYVKYPIIGNITKKNM